MTDVPELKLEDCINEECPRSGKPVAADSLVHYRGRTVGFCNPGCRDKFAKAVDFFDTHLSGGATVGST